jgi:hypothetical protein
MTPFGIYIGFIALLFVACMADIRKKWREQDAR